MDGRTMFVCLLVVEIGLALILGYLNARNGDLTTGAVAAAGANLWYSLDHLMRHFTH